MESIEAQVNHATLLERYEEAISALYKVYAQLFPELKDPWQRLAGDEIRHAEWMRTLRARIQDGSVRLSRQHMATTGQVLDGIDHMEIEMARAQEGNVSVVAALAIGVQLERSILERDWYRSFETDSAELQRVFQSLAAETAKHLEFLTKLSEERTRRQQAGSG
jgi:rubrerythrin